MKLTVRRYIKTLWALFWRELGVGTGIAALLYILLSLLLLLDKPNRISLLLGLSLIVVTALSALVMGALWAFRKMLRIKYHDFRFVVAPEFLKRYPNASFKKASRCFCAGYFGVSIINFFVIKVLGVMLETLTASLAPAAQMNRAAVIILAILVIVGAIGFIAISIILPFYLFRFLLNRPRTFGFVLAPPPSAMES